MPATGPLVALEILQANESDLDPLGRPPDSSIEAFLELDPGKRRQDIDAERWHTHPNVLVGLQEEARRKAGHGEPKCPDRCHQAFRILKVDRNPHVHIAGRARIPVVPHGVGAHDQVLNPLDVE